MNIDSNTNCLSAYYLRPLFKGFLLFAAFCAGAFFIKGFLTEGGITYLFPFLALFFALVSYHKKAIISVYADSYKLYPAPIHGVITVKFADITQLELTEGKAIFYVATRKRPISIYWFNFKPDEIEPLKQLLKNNHSHLIEKN